MRYFKQMSKTETNNHKLKTLSMSGLFVVTTISFAISGALSGCGKTTSTSGPLFTAAAKTPTSAGSSTLTSTSILTGIDTGTLTGTNVATSLNQSLMNGAESLIAPQDFSNIRGITHVPADYQKLTMSNLVQLMAALINPETSRDFLSEIQSILDLTQGITAQSVALRLRCFLGLYIQKNTHKYAASLSNITYSDRTSINNGSVRGFNTGSLRANAPSPLNVIGFAPVTIAVSQTNMPDLRKNFWPNILNETNFLIAKTESSSTPTVHQMAVSEFRATNNENHIPFAMQLPRQGTLTLADFIITKQDVYLRPDKKIEMRLQFKPRRGRNTNNHSYYILAIYEAIYR